MKTLYNFVINRQINEGKYELSTDNAVNSEVNNTFKKIYDKTAEDITAWKVAKQMVDNIQPLISQMKDIDEKTLNDNVQGIFDVKRNIEKLEKYVDKFNLTEDSLMYIGQYYSLIKMFYKEHPEYKEAALSFTFKNEDYSEIDIHSSIEAEKNIDNFWIDMKAFIQKNVKNLYNIDIKENSSKTYGKITLSIK